MSKESKEIYEFGPFRLDVGEHIFERSDGEKNPNLPEKAFQTLVVLIRNHGRLISKTELLNAVWPDSFVEENNLDKAIHAIRNALGEKSSVQKYVETVRKHGYRFVAEVRKVDRDGSLPTSDGPTPAFSGSILQPRITESGQHAVLSLDEWRDLSERLKTDKRPVTLISSDRDGEKAAPEEARARQTKGPVLRTRFPGKWRLYAASAVMMLMVIGAIALGYYLFARPTGGLGKRSIAVLPFKPIDSASRNEIYEVGIAHSLINQLGAAKGLVVRPLFATRKYADIEQDPIAAGKEQQAEYILVSNYQLADGKIRVTAELYDVATGQIEETYKSEKEAGNLFAMQDAVAGVLAHRLLAKFAPSESTNSAKRGTTNEEAYRLYLQGMYFYDNRDQTSLRKAIQALEEAVRLDPNYAQAWAGLAHSIRSITNLGRDGDPHEGYKESIDAVNKALALDPSSSQAHSALCDNKFMYEWDFAGAESECRRAIELDPDSSLAHQIYSRFLMGRGRFDEAIAEIKTAIDLDPASLFNQRLYGNCLWNARRYDEAVRQFKRVIAMDESFGTTYRWLSSTLVMAGKEEEAFEFLLKEMALQKADDETILAFKTAFRTRGWRGVLLEQASRFEKSPSSYFHGATYHAQLGNTDQAFEYLERSYKRREWNMHLLEVDPRLDNVRSDQRFGELVRRVGVR